MSFMPSRPIASEPRGEPVPLTPELMETLQPSLKWIEELNAQRRVGEQPQIPPEMLQQLLGQAQGSLPF